MPAITAVIHTNNDALRLGRALEMLYPCDEICVIDHASRDATVDVAREYGARVVNVEAEVPAIHSVPHDPSAWIFCLDPRESLTESLVASLYEWKTEHLPGGVSCFSVYLREETAQGWIVNPVAQTRLVPANWNRWEQMFPANDPAAVALEGELLRFVFP
jgi:glycosyltransferase involved in cell wall biosynthesis